MEERRVTVGQSAGDPDDAKDHAAIALASMAEAEVVAIADGGVGVPASRAAADTAVRAVTRTCRTSAARRPSTLMGEAFGDAHRAILQLSGQASAASGVGAACVAAVVQGGVATVARAGRMAAFHVRAGVAEAVFPETPGGSALGEADGEGGPRPLGRGVDAPPPIEVELVPLEPGDRIVLCTVSLARSVDGLTLARTVWTLEPQVAAKRLVDMAHRDGAASVAIQIVRREVPPLSGALDLLQPARQRQIGRQQDERRSREQRDRQRRIAVAAFWGLLALGIVGVIVAWYIGTERRQPASEPDASDSAAPAAPDAGAPDTVGLVGAFSRDAGAHPSTAAATDAVVGSDAGAAAGSDVADDGGGGAGGDATADAIVDAAPDATRTSDPELLALDEVFAQRPEEAARDLRRWIVDRYAEVGDRVFRSLDRYVRLRRGRHTVTVLVTLLDRRPPPKTRAWLRETLPELIAPDDGGP